MGVVREITEIITDIMVRCMRAITEIMRLIHRLRELFWRFWE